MQLRVGLLYPGSMGSSLARLLIANDAEVFTSLSGRSDRTRKFAADSGIQSVDSEEELLAAVDLVLSVLRPDKAIETAQRFAQRASKSAHVRARVYVDLNAISPSSAAKVEQAFAGTSIEVVDGGILGGPATVEPRKCPSVPLSGPHADEVVRLLQPAFGKDVRSIGDKVGQASALKMAFASLNKGRDAIITNTFTFAAKTGVLDALMEDLDARDKQSLEKAKRLQLVLPKAFRWIGEMREISHSFGEQGLEGGAELFEGAAKTWEDVEHTSYGKMTVEDAATGELDIIATAHDLAGSMGKQRTQT